jgi:hypothetical protein
MPTTMGACPPTRLSKTSLIVTEGLPSPSARTQNATTGPGPATQTPWSTKSSPQAPAPKSYRQAVPDSPLDLLTVKESTLEGYQALFDRASGGIREAGVFGDPERWRFDRERSYTREEWLDELPTSGALTRLPPEKLAEVLEGVGAAIDALGGGFTVHYTTVAVTAALTDAT